MVRVLSKGSELEYAHYVDWDETANVRDYDVVFVNLRDLERRKDEFLHSGVPERYHRMYEFPPQHHILQLLTSGGDLIVTLPWSVQVQPADDQDWEPPEPIPPEAPISPGTPILDMFSWLPLDLPVDDTGGESVDEDTIDEDWEWYFDDSFSWDMSFTTGRTTNEGARFSVDSLVENRYGQALAAEIDTNRSRGERGTELRPDWGSIYLLPLLEGWGIQDLAMHVMENLYPDVDIETVGRQPDWLADYDAPREEELETRVSDLERELAEARSFKRLLWEQDDELQEAVYDALRKAGLTVREEVPNRRDGAIDLDDEVVLLEITGTRGDVTEGKLSQLQKWVTNDEDEFEEDVGGLLAINHFMEEDPVDRELTMDPDRRSYLEAAELKMVTTMELFKMVNGLETGQIEEDDVEEKLREDNDILVFDEVDNPF